MTKIFTEKCGKDVRRQFTKKIKTERKKKKKEI